jgi:hypothetical protein
LESSPADTDKRTVRRARDEFLLRRAAEDVHVVGMAALGADGAVAETTRAWSARASRVEGYGAGRRIYDMETLGREPGGIMRPPFRTSAGLVVAALLSFAAPPGAIADGSIDPGPTPRALCGPGSRPEPGMQGRVSGDEISSGRASQGYTCNTELVSRFGNIGINGGAGGYRVYRYVDAAGHTCGYYDSTLLFPGNATAQTTNLVGVYVLNMSDPSRPVKTANLVTPAMLSPHESLSLNAARGLLAADMGYPTFQPGFLDVYDISQDCLHPTLASSTLLGILGHEGNFTPDGTIYYVSSAGGHTLTAVDLTNPLVPSILWTTTDYSVHGLNVSDDGNRLYFADLGNAGLTILDVSQVQQRVPNPSVPVVSHLTWPEVSIPQTDIPVTIGGHPYLVEIDEFARGIAAGNPSAPVGAARIIDIADDTRPAVVSNIRLEVHMPENIAAIAGDPGASNGLQGYAGHYCAVPQREEPGIVACSFILSGMRVFDIRDPSAPKEIAYFNGPIPAVNATGSAGTSYAMSAPAFDPARGDIWYSDGNSGFYAVHVTNGVWPFA